MKRTITVLLIALMLICCINITAFAVTNPSPGDTWCVNNDAVQITQAGSYIITGTGATTNTITVDSNIVGDVNITLSDVNIDVHATENACAFSIGQNTTVNLTLTDSTVNTLISGKNMAGVKVPSNAALNIDGTGTLNVQGGLCAAGIGGAGTGGSVEMENGPITINSGIINAIGGANCISDFSGAGIGAGYGKRVECGLITINGGTINATGGGGAAGIGGGGWQSKVSTITITDGTVTVRSNKGGSGIGSGYDAINSGTVIISGGTVNAYGTNGGAAIGGGCSSHGSVVTVSGGAVRALSNSGGAGIGGGSLGIHGGNGGTVAISGGEVYVESLGAMAIGAGNGGTNEGTLKISSPSALFIKEHKDIAMLSMQNAYNYLNSETITGSSAYGYTNFPSTWEGGRAYGYIPAAVTSYHVGFNSQSGSSVSSQTVDEGGKATKPSAPTRTGYSFGGWYTDSSCNDGNEWNFAHCTIAGNITLYAKWTAIPASSTYTVSFDSQSGSTVASQTVNEGDKATKPNNPTRSGYTFDGWYTHSGCDYDDRWNFNVCPVLKTTTLYAKWTAIPVVSTYTVTLNSQGGSDVINQAVKKGEKATKPSDPARAGYTFGGWYTNNVCNNGDEWNFIHCTITQDITLYAKWIADPVTPTYTVTFNTGSGSDVISQTVNEGEKATRPTNPTLLGYTFGGWYTDNSCNDGDEWNFNACTVLHNTTLHAKWLKQTGINVTQITFDNAYSSIKPQTQRSLKDICPYTITPNNASDLSVTWISSNTDVATISDGKIHALSEGKTIITATANDTGNGTLTSKMIVEVMDNTATGLDANGRSITGAIKDNSGNVLAGYGITLYSLPKNTLSEKENGFSYKEVSFDHHTLVVSNPHGEEIGRFSLNFNNTGSQAYSLDNDKKTAEIDYASYTTGINLTICLNAAESEISIADISINGNGEVPNPNTGGTNQNATAVDVDIIETDTHSRWTAVFSALLWILISGAVLSTALIVTYIIFNRKKTEQ